MIDTVGDLKEVRVLLEKGWCQNAAAKNKKGKIVGLTDEAACSFCLTAAVDKIAVFAENSERSQNSYTRGRFMFNAITEAGDFYDVDDLVRYNDNYLRTEAQIIDLVSRAIRLEEKRAER